LYVAFLSSVVSVLILSATPSAAMPLKITKALMKKAMKAKKANDAKWSPVLDEWGIDTYGVLYRLASGELVEFNYILCRGGCNAPLKMLGPSWDHLGTSLSHLGPF